MSPAPCRKCGNLTPFDLEHRCTKGRLANGDPRWATVCRPCSVAYAKAQRKSARERATLNQPTMVWGGPEIPSAPMVAMLQKMIRWADGGGNVHWFQPDAPPSQTKENVLAGYGVNVRSFDRWRTGESPMLRFDFADYIIGRSPFLWWEVYDKEKYPKEHRQVARLFGGVAPKAKKAA